MYVDVCRGILNAYRKLVLKNSEIKKFLIWKYFVAVGYKNCGIILISAMYFLYLFNHETNID